MNKTILVAALMCGSAFTFATPAAAQGSGQPPEAQQEQTQPDQSDAAADAAIAAAAPVDDSQAKIELLQQQVEALQESLAEMQKAMVKTTPTWKGGPLLEDKEAGWSFKPRGRIMYDIGYVENPGDRIRSISSTQSSRNLGFNTRARRIRLGAEGTIPGGFGYKFEMDFANSNVGFGDAIITYAPAGKPYNFTVGNHESMDGLEQISSSRYISFLERAAFNDAFVNTRRIGASFGINNPAGDLRFNAGVFAAHSIDGGFDNDGWIGAARAVYAPLVGGNQLHFGLNFQHREFQSNNGATASNSQGAPSTNQVARYRARPFTQTTDVRFVDTGNFAAKSDNIFGAEFIGIFKSLHLTAEGQYLKANAYNRGETFDAGDTRDFFSSNGALASSFLVPGGDPTFWGGYVEAGYFLTGETRGYKNGLWDRTKVLNPFSKGGWGAFQINGRVDYLDLDSSKLKTAFTNDFLTGASTQSINLGRGGKQLGLLTSLLWIPEDYFRIYLQYARASITGGPQAGVVKPNSTKPLDERKYNVDTVTARASIDF